MDDISALTLQVAEHLSKRRVVIRWRYPVSSTASAQTYKASDGRIFIDITPFDSAQKKLELFLHELAHALHDYEWIPADDKQKKSSGSIQVSRRERDAWSRDTREIRANKQAAEWLEFAEKYAHRYYLTRSTTLLGAYLIALLDWR